MALLISTNHQMFDDRTGRHYCVQTVAYDGTETTVNVPEGPVDSVILCADTTVTKPTVTVSSSTLLATLAAGGTPATLLLVTLHIGNAAGL